MVSRCVIPSTVDSVEGIIQTVAGVLDLCDEVDGNHHVENDSRGSLGASYFRKGAPDYGYWVPMLKTPTFISINVHWSALNSRSRYSGLNPERRRLREFTPSSHPGSLRLAGQIDRLAQPVYSPHRAMLNQGIPGRESHRLAFLGQCAALGRIDVLHTDSERSYRDRLRDIFIPLD